MCKTYLSLLKLPGYSPAKKFIFVYTIVSKNVTAHYFPVVTSKYGVNVLPGLPW